MTTHTSDRRPESERDRNARHPRRQGFHKERATLWLLTVTLGLGLGTATRLLLRADQALPAQAGRVPPQSAPSQDGGVPFQNQRVVVLPQRSYGARATTRMS